MTKYYRKQRYRNNSDTLDIYINWYTTKNGYIKFDIEIFAKDPKHKNALIRIAKYNTAENAMKKYIETHPDFYLMEDITK